MKLRQYLVVAVLAFGGIGAFYSICHAGCTCTGVKLDLDCQGVRLADELHECKTVRNPGWAGYVKVKCPDYYIDPLGTQLYHCDDSGPKTCNEDAGTLKDCWEEYYCIKGTLVYDKGCSDERPATCTKDPEEGWNYTCITCDKGESAGTYEDWDDECVG